MRRGSGVADKAYNDGFMAGITSALTVITEHGEGVLWREVLHSCGEPEKVRKYCEKEDLLELCGFDEFKADWEHLLRVMGRR